MVVVASLAAGLAATMSAMGIDEHIDQLAVEGPRLADAAQSAGLAAAVPGCPGWQVRDLVTHVGGVHRWAASIVGGALADNDDVTGDRVGTGPADPLLIGWFRDGHRALVQTLRDAPGDLACFTFLPAPCPLAFWARRQAHETAIHRADALALDGIDEILTGFAPRPRTLLPGTLRIEPAGDAPWLVTLGPRGVTATRTRGQDMPADVTVRGSATDIYLWLWNRPAVVTITGDAAIADQWQQIRVRWN
jgi:uncharacterized protein (TIGR03083 family)